MEALDPELIAKLLSNEREFMRLFFRIPNKNSVPVPFDFKPAQVQLDNDLGLRNLVVKPSQIGSTTYFTGKFLFRTMYRPNTTSVIVAHEEFLTQRLLNRAQFIYDNLPPELRPVMAHKSSFEKSFPDINSVMYIGTARAQVFGRGEPIHNLLFSEAAFYPERAWDNIVLPSLQRVPPGGTVVLESTPNGESGFFYEQIQRALQDVGSFRVHILKWWQEPDNFLPEGSVLVSKESRWEFDYTAEEQVLAEEHGLTREQIRWRRWKQRELGPLFYQEHLESLETCFLTVGQPWYDPGRIEMLRRGCHEPIKREYYADIWVDPEEGHTYVMGVDPGQGKHTSSEATVWDLTDPAHPKHVASLGGFYEPARMAELTMRLGFHYNTALLVPEANSQGIAYCQKITEYPRLYYREDVVSGRRSMQIGWQTSPRTKPFMMAELARHLPTLETHDAELVRQMSNFRDLGNGAYETTGFDDRHDSACFAMISFTHRLPGNRRGFLGTSGWTW